MKCLLAVLLLLLAVSMGQVAFAGAILELTDGTNSVTLDTSGNLITSGSVSTVIYSGVPGELTWDGTLGAWSVNVTTGLGSPLEPAATLDLDSIDVSSGSSDLKIFLSQNNNSLNIAGNMAWTLNFGGTLESGTGATVTYSAFENNANTLLALTTPIGVLGPLSPVSFSGSAVGPAVSVSGDYSLTEEIAVDAVGATLYSGDASLTPVPEPTSLLLLGGGLVGLACITRKRNRS